MEITLQTLLLKVVQGLENPTDVVQSIGTWNGHPSIKYVLHVRRADGTEYEINI